MSEWMHGLKGLIALVGSIVTVAGSAVGVLIAAGVIDVGGDKQPENQPPAIGSIRLQNPDVGPGQSTPADVIVTDPDRDSLEIRWLADTGTFLQGNSGSQVIYQPPDSGASVQLTVEVSDGRNPPVSVSQTFNLRLPTPTPTVTPARLPTLPVEPLAGNSPQDLSLDPAPEIPASGLDLTGRWANQFGYLEFSPDGFGGYNFSDFDVSGLEVGQGTAEFEGQTLFLDGEGFLIDSFGNPFYIVYYGEMNIVSDLMQGDLFSSFDDTYLGTVQFLRDTGR